MLSLGKPISNRASQSFWPNRSNCFTAVVTTLNYTVQEAHILFGTRPENFHANRLAGLGIGSALRAAEGAAVGQPAEYIEMLHGKSGVGVTTADHLGDGYYSGVISSMRFTSYSYDDLDYSNPFYAWVGENLRSVVGDERLAAASDTTLIVGTVAFSAALVASVYFAPAAALQAAATGAAMGFVIDVGFQVAANYDAGESLFKIDWSQAANAAAIGGTIGALTGGLGTGLGALGKMFPVVCRVVSPMVNIAMRGAAAYQVYSGIQQIRQGNYATGTLTASLGMFGMFAKGSSFCFVAGTLVVRQRIDANVAFAHAQLPRDASDDSAKSDAFTTSSLTAFGCAVLLIGIATQRVLSRRADEEEAEAIRARALDEALREAIPEDAEREHHVSLPDQRPNHLRYDLESGGRIIETIPVPTPSRPLKAVDDENMSADQDPGSRLAATGSLTDSQPTLVRATRPRRTLRRSSGPKRQTAKSSWHIWGAITAAILLLGLAGSWESSGKATSGNKGVEFRPVTQAPQLVNLGNGFLGAPIESIELGQRVIADNPEDDDAIIVGSWEEDTATLRTLQCICTKRDGSQLQFELIRDLEWIAEHRAWVGCEIDSELEEFGVVGSAKVVAVNACPELETGDGSLVTGIFRHDVAAIYRLQLSDGVSIGVTAEHPFWSADRNQFVPAADLQIGEKLATVDGSTIHVASLTAEPGKHRVFNLEVDGEHVYYVSSSGILVHNTCKAHKTGRRGEHIALRYLRGTGFKEIVKIQNRSGHGIDILAKDPTTKRWVAFEIKSSTGPVAPRLSADQARLRANGFVNSRLGNATRWRSASPATNRKAGDILNEIKAQGGISGEVISVTNISGKPGAWTGSINFSNW